MEELTHKTVAVFAQPFTVPGFGETLPAGEYEIETELASPPDHLHPKAWKASVLVTLHPLQSQPGLARTLTVSLTDLDDARAKDKLTGKTVSDVFLDEMLADPMVQLVMAADGVSAAHLRHIYAGLTPAPEGEEQDMTQPQPTVRDKSAIQAAENEGMPTRPKGADITRRRLHLGPT